MKYFDFIYSNNTEGVAIISYRNPTATHLSIPEKLNGRPVTQILRKSFEYALSLTEIHIPRTVTRIYSYAFVGCWNLKAFTVDPENPCFFAVDGVLYDKKHPVLKLVPPACDKFNIPENIVQIDAEAMIGCFHLKSLTLPEQITTIEYKAFRGCCNLTTILLSSNVKNIHPLAFSGCNSLEEIIIDPVNPYYSFSDGVLYDKEKSSVIYVCKMLHTVSFADTVSYMHPNALSDCRFLNKIALPDGTAQIYEDTFENCTQLTELTIPQSVSFISASALSSCPNLETVYLDSSNKYYRMEHGVLYNQDMSQVIFVPKDCTALTIYDKTEEKLHSLFKIWPHITQVFLWHEKDEQAVITGCCLKNDEWTAIPDGCLKQDEQAAIADGHLKRVGYLTIPERIHGYPVTQIYDDTFSDCFALTEIILPNTIQRIGARAFFNCKNLSEIRLSDQITEIGTASFYNCIQLTSLTLPENLVKIHDLTFYGCKNLRELVIPKNVIQIGKLAFWGCRNLIPSVICNIHATGLSAAEFGAFSVDSKKSVPVFIIGTGTSAPASDDFIAETEKSAPVSDDFITETEKSAPVFITRKNQFASRSDLIHIVTDTKTQEISGGCFFECTNLERVVVTSNVYSLGKYAFRGCHKLKEVIMPDSLNSIGTGCFTDCTSLKEIHIPLAVTQIRRKTFAGCSSLTRIVLSENIRHIGSKAFSGCSGLTIAAPAGSYAQHYALEMGIAFEEKNA